MDAVKECKFSPVWLCNIASWNLDFFSILIFLRTFVFILGSFVHILQRTLRICSATQCIHYVTSPSFISDWYVSKGRTLQQRLQGIFRQSSVHSRTPSSGSCCHISYGLLWCWKFFSMIKLPFYLYQLDYIYKQTKQIYVFMRTRACLEKNLDRSWQKYIITK